MPPIMDILCYQVRSVVPSPQPGAARPPAAPARHFVLAADGQIAAKPYVLLCKQKIWSSLLRESGVVFVRAEGRKCMIRLREDDLEARFPGLLGTVLTGYENADDDRGEGDA